MACGDGQDKSEWKASKLATKLGLSPRGLQRRMHLWLAHGVVTESKASRGETMYRAAGEPTTCQMQ